MSKALDPGSVAADASDYLSFNLQLPPVVDWTEAGAHEELGRFIHRCHTERLRDLALRSAAREGVLTAEDAAALSRIADGADGGEGPDELYDPARFTVRLQDFDLVEAPPVPLGSKVRWEAVFAPEGKLTSDGRVFAPGAVTWRDLPLTLMAMIETSEGGHVGAQVCGKIEEIWRDEAAGLIRAAGYFDDGEYGAEIARLVEDRTLRGLSVDLAIFESEVGPEEDYFDEAGDWRDAATEADPDSDVGWGEGIYVIRRAEIGMATVCPFPAFAEARIEVGRSLVAAGGAELAIVTLTFDGGARIIVEKPKALVAAAAFGDAPSSASGTLLVSGLTASAAGLVPEAPPRDWFADPGLDALTPLVVTDDGWIFGHAWPWEIDGAPACHTAFPGECVTAPHSETGYAYFHLSEIVCDDGSRVPCGKITLDTSHAGQNLSRAEAARHYDHTGTVVAYVVVGEDEFGGWFSGCLAPEADADTVRKLRGSTPSGDWRNVQGGLELVALLEVNVPGFPVPRTASAYFHGAEIQSLVAAGARALALVAAGEPPPASPSLPPEDLARLEAIRDLVDGRYLIEA